MTLQHSQCSHDRAGHRRSTLMGSFSRCDRAEIDIQNAVNLSAPVAFERMTASFCRASSEQSPKIRICMVDQTRRDFGSLVAFAEHFCSFKRIRCVIWRTETGSSRYIHDPEDSSGASACLTTWVRWALREAAQTPLRESYPALLV